MKRYFPTILVSIIFIGLLIFTLYSNKNSAKEEPSKVVLETNKNDINWIVVKSESNLIISRKDKEYVLYLEDEVLANKEKADDIFNTASKVEYQSIVSENPKDLEQFGLKKAKIRINIGNKDNEAKSLFVGNQTPTDDGYYVKTDDNKRVYKVSSEIIEKFTQPVDDLIQKQILSSLNKEKIDKIEVEYNKQKYLFSKVNDIWSFNGKQLKRETSNEALDRFVELNIDGISKKENYADVTNPSIKVIVYQGKYIVSNLSVFIGNGASYNVLMDNMGTQYYISSSSFDNYKNTFSTLFLQL